MFRKSHPNKLMTYGATWWIIHILSYAFDFFTLQGSPLPSPRLVSVNIHNDVSAPHVRYSLMMMQWGQFVDHDLTHTPVNR